MSLLDKASLIVTPNSYKESKLYSVVPNTTLGDMDVVRATTATRVNSAGLIEVVPRNLFTYSQQFTNAAWLDGGGGTAVFTDNFAISPNGTTTAARWTAANINSQVRQNVSTINNTSTISVWMRTNSGTKNATLFINDSAVQSTITVTTTWQRFTLTGATGGTLLGAGRTGFSNNSVLTNSDYIEVWGAQFENFATATEYFPTTTRLNIPRIDYTNGSCPSLLVEPQRTNLLTYSEQFDNAAWTKSNATVTANTINSPSGTLTADKLVENSTNNIHYVNGGSITFTAGTYSISIFAKAAERNILQIFLNGSANVDAYANFNLTTGVVSAFNAATATIQSVGDGWYRCNLTATIAASTVPSAYYCIQNSTTATRAASYLGNGTSGLFIWGAQLELGSYPTSYIPTVASTVTRNADVISKTGISSLIGQTEGTMFCDVTLNSRVSFSYFAIATNLASAANYLGIAFLNNAIAFESVVAGALQANISHSNTSTGRFKIAAAYKANDFVLYINGVQIGVDTSGTIPTCSEIGLSVFNQAQALNYNSAQLYKTRLSNSELAQLTTL